MNYCTNCEVDYTLTMKYTWTTALSTSNQDCLTTAQGAGCPDSKSAPRDERPGNKVQKHHNKCHFCLKPLQDQKFDFLKNLEILCVKE